MSERKLLSIVIPVFNEGGNVARAHRAVVDALEPLKDRYDLEILFGDNRSEDGSFEVIRGLSTSDARVRGVRYSRNFGYQRSIYACFMLARGDAVIQLDCDLQDPPELIPEMVGRWEDGAKVVYGIRRSRQEGELESAARRAFYWLVDRLSDDDLPRDAGDFRLLDRRVVEVMRQVYDANPYLRGTVAALGFDQVGIEYDRRAREMGQTHFTWNQLAGLALDGILNHSVLPLRLATLVGMLAAGVALGLIAVYSFARVVLARPWPAGFTTLAVLSLATLSLNALLLGVIGEYLGRMYRQVRGAPIVVIDETVNLEAPRSTPGIV